MQSLGAKAYHQPYATKSSESRMVATYHSGTSPSIQEIVLASLKDPSGKVRIVIATSALGMGVDIKGLHRIISYGPPSDIENLPYKNLGEPEEMAISQKPFFSSTVGSFATVR